MMNFSKVVAFLTLGLVQAQPNLLAQPVALWEAKIIPSVAGALPDVLYGNGVAVSPDGATLVSTSVSGVVTAYDALTGEFLWDFPPPSESGGVITSHSLVVFPTANSITEPYMVYSIIENEADLTATTRVIALDPDGNLVFSSDPLPGVAAGSPVISDDGTFIFLTHNSELNTVGHFTALQADSLGSVFYTGSNATSPFAPVGIFHSPVEGNYDGDEGRGNTNDMLMWAQSPNPNEETVSPGYLFGFQFPFDFDPALSTNTSYFLLGADARDFRSNTAPTMTNQGLNGFFSASRSSFWGWVGTVENPRGRFNRPSNMGTVGFTRNPTFAGAPCFAAPAVTSDATAPLVMGGTASTEFVRLSADFSVTDVITTTGFVLGQARLDPFDRAAYFAETTGVAHQVPTTGDFLPTWTYNLTGSVEGEIAISPSGWILYVADVTGVITALQITEVPPTEAPSLTPTALNSTAPTMAPIVGTAAPSVAPVAETVEEPTAAPVAATLPPSGAAQPMILVAIASVVLALFL